MAKLPGTKFNERFRIVLQTGTQAGVLYKNQVFYSPGEFDVVIGNGKHSFQGLVAHYNNQNVQTIMQVALFVFDYNKKEWLMRRGENFLSFNIIRFKNLESALLFKLSYVE